MTPSSDHEHSSDEGKADGPKKPKIQKIVPRSFAPEERENSEIYQDPKGELFDKDGDCIHIEAGTGNVYKYDDDGKKVKIGRIERIEPREKKEKLAPMDTRSLHEVDIPKFKRHIWEIPIPWTDQTLPVNPRDLPLICCTFLLLAATITQKACGGSIKLPDFDVPGLNLKK